MIFRHNTQKIIHYSQHISPPVVDTNCQKRAIPLYRIYSTFQRPAFCPFDIHFNKPNRHIFCKIINPNRMYLLCLLPI